MTRERSIHYSVEAEAGFVRFVFGSTFVFEEWSDAMRAVFSHPAYRVGFGFLLDRRAAPPPTVDGLHRMVAFIGENRAKCAGSRWAVVTSGVADYGMARMAQALVDDHPTTMRIFETIEQAIAWLIDETADIDAAVPSARSTRKPRVLIVDDEEAERVHLSAILERAGYEVLVASDGAHALRIFLEEPVRAVVTDIVMPGRDGLHLIANLRGIRPDVPIVAVSGKGRTGLTIADMMGAGRILEKPVAAPELLRAIAEAIPA